MDELTFYRAVATVTCEPELEPLVGRALEAAIRLTGADGGHLVLPGAEQPMIAASRGETGAEPAVSQRIVGRVLRERSTLRLENALEAAEYRDLASVRRFHILSVLATPVLHGDAAVGAIYLVSTRLAGIFQPDAATILADFAARIAPALAASQETQRLRAERRALEVQLAAHAGLEELVGADPAFRALLAELSQVAPSSVPVLIQGESGTGKELVARALHRLWRGAVHGPTRRDPRPADSTRRDPRPAGSTQRGPCPADPPFVAINCGAIPETLLESELFGHEKGAFTGARARAGKLVAADGGTLFLDEVSELSPACQVGLLRALQSGEVQRVGSDEVQHVDVRVVAACNRPLRQLVQEGRFREDLFYRLAAITLRVPPLRERGDDVLLLAEHLLRRHAAPGAPALRLSQGAARLLRAHPFPGNVRELENVIRRATVFAREGEVRAEDLPPELREAPATPASTPADPAPRAGAPATRDELEQQKRAAAAALERAFADEVLRRAHGNVAEAARAAGVNRSSLHELMRKHGVDAHRYRGLDPAGPLPRGLDPAGPLPRGPGAGS